jgi:hypothetical protein
VIQGNSGGGTEKLLVWNINEGLHESRRELKAWKLPIIDKEKEHLWWGCGSICRYPTVY